MLRITPDNLHTSFFNAGVKLAMTLTKRLPYNCTVIFASIDYK
jgi:hypothetical protein